MTTTVKINSGVTADYGYDWAGFRRLLDGTQSRLAYLWTEDSEYYTVVASDDTAYYHVQIAKTSPASEDQHDFEAEFKGKRKDNFEGTKATVVETNNSNFTLTESLQTQLILGQILLELKKMNAHLRTITDEENIELDL